MIAFFSGQLRKPLVEKLRRERINSSIEQLKSLLGPGLKQQPDSKLEKADILERTVCILRRVRPLDFPAVDGVSCPGDGTRPLQGGHADAYAEKTDKVPEQAGFFT